MQKTVRIDILNRAHHLNQPLLGFYRWAKKSGYSLILRDCSQSEDYRCKKAALVVYIDQLRLAYDMDDGYQSPEATEYLLGLSDYYFKRSFSDDKNRELNYQGIYPYGLYYDVTWPGNPLARKRRLGLIRTAWECATGTLVTPDRVEGQPDWDGGRRPTILFLAGLWPEEGKRSPAENEERREINHTRIQIMRRLRESFPEHAVVGLKDNAVGREMAPDLIIANSRTKRARYIAAMKHADICVATTGLHGSIGGKFGEYVAASRAIVSEKLHYSVPGDFRAGQNYLEFGTPDQCMEQIHFLTDHPEAILEMQRKNRAYYQAYLEPERLIRNTLKVAGIE